MGTSGNSITLENNGAPVRIFEMNVLRYFYVKQTSVPLCDPVWFSFASENKVSYLQRWENNLSNEVPLELDPEE